MRFFRRRRGDAPQVKTDALAPLPVEWTNAVEPGTALHERDRCAIAVRLGVIGETWCIELLEAALRDDPAQGVREQAWRELLHLRTSATASS
ncbi:MAG: hypothetical protein ACREMP_11560 [Candidatus Tyrphobacter sp.]